MKIHAQQNGLFISWEHQAIARTDADWSFQWSQLTILYDAEKKFSLFLPTQNF